MEFSIKETEQKELFIRTNLHGVFSTWKLLESSIDLHGAEHLFVTEPNRRSVKISVFAKTNDKENITTPISNITLGELISKHNLGILVPQIGLAIEKLNEKQLVEKKNQKINKNNSINAIGCNPC